MATPKRVIYNTLENLKSDDFTVFIWHLENPTEGIEPIPESKLENANRQKVVDLMVKQYTDKAGTIAVKVLRDMKQNDLASDLERKLQGDVPAGGGASSSGTSVTPQTTGVTMTIRSSNGGTVNAPLIHGCVVNGSVNLNSKDKP
ncbi:caspase b-like [Chanodichthys erythropterus]|uniref:caspase b-like n=1 Tax=Chanodichthys erythropterus TaxID=933992 RepID=UPI00351EBBEA